MSDEFDDPILCDFCDEPAKCECEYVERHNRVLKAKQTPRTTLTDGVVVCNARLCRKCRAEVKGKWMCPDHAR